MVATENMPCLFKMRVTTNQMGSHTERAVGAAQALTTRVTAGRHWSWPVGRTWSPTRSSAAVIAQQASIPGCCRGSRGAVSPGLGHGAGSSRSRRGLVMAHACAHPLRGTDCVCDSARAATSFAGLQ